MSLWNHSDTGKIPRLNVHPDKRWSHFLPSSHSYHFKRTFKSEGPYGNRNVPSWPCFREGQSGRHLLLERYSISFLLLSSLLQWLSFLLAAVTEKGHPRPHAESWSEINWLPPVQSVKLIPKQTVPGEASYWPRWNFEQTFCCSLI